MDETEKGNSNQKESESVADFSTKGKDGKAQQDRNDNKSIHEDKNWNRNESEMSEQEFAEASQTMFGLMRRDDPDAFNLDSDWASVNTVSDLDDGRASGSRRSGKSGNSSDFEQARKKKTKACLRNDFWARMGLRVMVNNGIWDWILLLWYLCDFCFSLLMF